MTKIILNNVVNLSDNPTAINSINNNSATIVAAIDNTLSRDGTSPNVMNASLDMNSNAILNLPAALSPTSPLRLQDLTTFIGGGTVNTILPVGGTTGQALTKTSNTDYAVGWANSGGTVTSVGLSLPADFTITNSPVTTTGTLTGAWATTPTGTGAVVRATSPTLVTPVLGTPASGVATNLTGTASGLTAGTVTTNANLTGVITSSGNATSIASQTGTGTKFVVDTSPVLVTPTLGVATATTINGSTVSPGQYSGTTTNDNATAGNIGEYVFAGTKLGGITSATVTITNASPGVVTWTAHGFLDNSPVYFTTTGTLPTGFSPSTPYYVVPSSQTANTFTLSATIGGAAINTSSAGSGVHTGFNALPVNNSGINQNITSMVLTAGDWDVNVMGFTTGGATTNVTYVLFSVSSVSASLDTTGGRETIYPQIATPFAGGGGIGLPINSVRFSLAGTTTIYMVINSVFTTSTMSAYGCMHARRVR